MSELNFNQLLLVLVEHFTQKKFFLKQIFIKKYNFFKLTMFLFFLKFFSLKIVKKKFFFQLNFKLLRRRSYLE